MSRPSSLVAAQKAVPDWMWEHTECGKVRCIHTIRGVRMVVDVSQMRRGGSWSAMATEVASDDTDPGKVVDCVGDAGGNLPAAILRAAHRLVDRVTRRDGEVQP